jgi:hypothetical protein
MMGLRTDKAGFDTRHFEFVYQALLLFKEMYGHVDVRPTWYLLSFYCC